MKILICGHNADRATEHFKSIKSKHSILSHSAYNLFSETMKDSYNADLVRFAQICSQGFIPGCINIYQQTPWSEQKLIEDRLTDEQNLVVSTYYNLLGWKPDIVIYLYSDEYDESLEKCMDIDNPDDVKIFKLYANEQKLLANLMLIYERILIHYPTNKLLKIAP